MYVRNVEIQPIELERLAALLTPGRAEQLRQVIIKGRELLTDRVVWNVNATAQGGGVAEMLQTLLAYVRGADVDTRWLVLSADPAFFAITKRLHNVLHGEPGDGGPLGDAERDHYTDVLRANHEQMASEVRGGDVVLLHDPQTAGMVDGLRAAGAHVVWRCHIGRDTPNELTDRGWAFLRPFIENSDAFIFSRRDYAPEWVSRDRLWVIPPSIDPFSTKNRPLTPAQVMAALTRAGLIDASFDTGGLGFHRRGGNSGIVKRHDQLVTDGPPPPPGARLVIQVSRWDRLKDMSGVLTGFADRVGALPGDVHLMLVGPEVSGVTDDPEGAEVLEESRKLWKRLPVAARQRIHLTCLPMDDVDENAHLVNALQHHASVVVQKSLVEGFGLTVTEAMWKARPVVASAVGGIQDQIVDGEHGLLISDPYDLAAMGQAVGRLLSDDVLAMQMGEAARARVQDQFLGDRHLTQYVDLFGTMIRSR